MATKNVTDLLVFGYACKIFRDDEKALHIDQGKHLIPWMGDNTLKIDRYDVRATLSDVSQFEAPPGGYANRLDYLSPAEQRAEQLCEEERYFSLYNNDFEEELYKEENQKRSTSGYGQIGFNYDESSSPSQNSANEKADNEVKDETPDEIYVPHPRFYIPPNMELPESTKVQAIIEKTARFISTQGPQMEILIKAKQANNPLFDFLNQSGRLNPFYKHTLQAMKDGNYPADDQKIENTQSLPSCDTSGSMYQSYYSSNTPVLSMPTIKYKPSADCAYTQLISKIKGVHEQAKVPLSIPSQQSMNVSTKTEPKTDVEVKKISNGLMLAQCYNSDSDDEEEGQSKDDTSLTDSKNIHGQQQNGNLQIATWSIPTLNPDIPVPSDVLCPPPELRAIIEKTASYVLKNGKEFEDILRTKNDQRFTFLQYTDPYYKYYSFKLTGIVCPDISVLQANEANSQPEKPNTLCHYEKKSSKFDASKPINPVSFSIKTKEDTASTSLKPALPIEHSSDEEMEPESERKIEQNSQITSKILLLPSNNDNNTNQSFVDVEQSDSFIRDTILEQQNLNEKKLVKRAEDKIKDRLAQLAREKLGSLSKEKQLQIERRRRALAFLNQINGEDAEPKPEAKCVETALSTNEITSIELNDENDSNHSDSSDSVTFVMATTSTSICAAATQTVQKQRNIRSGRSNESDHRRSRSRTRSRSRSRSTSSRHYRHKSSKCRKKSSKHKRSRSRSRSESRSRTNRHDYKRKSRSSSKVRKRRYSED